MRKEKCGGTIAGRGISPASKASKLAEEFANILVRNISLLSSKPNITPKLGVLIVIELVR